MVLFCFFDWLALPTLTFFLAEEAVHLVGRAGTAYAHPFFTPTDTMAALSLVRRRCVRRDVSGAAGDRPRLLAEAWLPAAAPSDPKKPIVEGFADPEDFQRAAEKNPIVDGFSDVVDRPRNAETSRRSRKPRA